MKLASTWYYAVPIQHIPRIQLSISLSTNKAYYYPYIFVADLNIRRVLKFMAKFSH